MREKEIHLEMNNLNMSVSGFDVELEHIVSIVTWKLLWL